MQNIIYKATIVAGLAFTIASCASKEEKIAKQKEAFIKSCNDKASSTPAASGYDFKGYCDCAWDKVISDKKVEELITSGKGDTKEAEEYVMGKFNDAEFMKQLQSCFELIKQTK